MNPDTGSGDQQTAEDQEINLMVARRIVNDPQRSLGVVIVPLHRAQRIDDATTSPAPGWAEGWRYANCWSQHDGE